MCKLTTIKWSVEIMGKVEFYKFDTATSHLQLSFENHMRGLLSVCTDVRQQMTFMIQSQPFFTSHGVW